MILIKTAFNNLKKNKIINIFSIIQMIIVFCLICFMISSAYIRYQYYKPFKDYFSSNGIYYNYGETFTNKDPSVQAIPDFIDSDTLLKKVNGAESIISCYKAQIFSYDDLEFKNIVYDDEMLTRFQPQLKEGRWMNITSDAREVEVVISENNYGWKVGDTLKFGVNNYPDDVSFYAKIVGMIEDGTKVIGFSSLGDNLDYNNFYTNYDLEIEGTPIVMFSKTSFDSIESDVEIDPLIKDAIPTTIAYCGVITTSSELTDDDISDISVELGKFSNGGLAVENLKDFNANTIKYIWNQLKTLMPIVIILVIMVLISSISISAISSRVRLRDFVIYYITGLQWKQCIFINLTQSAIISAISFVLSFVAIFIINATPLSKNIAIILNGYTILSMIILIILYMIISMIMPVIIIGKNTPKQILTR